MVCDPKERKVNDANDFIFYNTNGDGMKNEQYLNFLLMFGGGGPWTSVVSDYESRVLTDGGTIESLNCVTNAVKFMMQNP